METQFHIVTNKLRKQYEVKQNLVQVNAVKSQPQGHFLPVFFGGGAIIMYFLTLRSAWTRWILNRSGLRLS